jgi:hypothetical protein
MTQIPSSEADMQFSICQENPALQDTPRFITVFTKARRLSLTQARSTRSSSMMCFSAEPSDMRKRLWTLSVANPTQNDEAILRSH